MQDGVAEDYGRSWYAATAVAAPERPPLAADLDVDVCVIGGGLAGLTAAREIARLGWSVVVLEAKRIAWSASGRNCGFVLPGFAADIHAIVERVGLDQAKTLWALADAGLEYVRTTIDECDMPGVQPRRGWLDVSKVDTGDEMIALVGLLGQEFGASVEGWPTEQVREVLRSERYFHAIHYPCAFHINPLNYALGLARAAEEAGVRIFECTQAMEIDPAGVRKRVLTPSALVRASHVVLAGNTHIGGVMPRLAETLLPVTSYVAVTEPLGERLSEAIAYTGAVSDSRFANYHYRVVDNDRLMWAGGGGPFAPDPRRVGETFKAAMARTYPQLGEVTIAYTWSGTMGFAVHRMPQIGEVSPGLWVASAFAGHGINTSAIAGNLVARAIAENDDNWRQFLPYDLVWAGGRIGRVSAQAYFFVRNWREEIEATRAQRRERSRLAKPEPAGPDAAEATTAKAGDLRKGQDQSLDQQNAYDADDKSEIAAAEVDRREAKQAIGPARR